MSHITHMCIRNVMMPDTSNNGCVFDGLFFKFSIQRACLASYYIKYNGVKVKMQKCVSSPFDMRINFQRETYTYTYGWFYLTKRSLITLFAHTHIWVRCTHTAMATLDQKMKRTSHENNLLACIRCVKRNSFNMLVALYANQNAIRFHFIPFAKMNCFCLAL